MPQELADAFCISRGKFEASLPVPEVPAMLRAENSSEGPSSHDGIHATSLWW